MPPGKMIFKAIIFLLFALRMSREFEINDKFFIF